MKELIVVIVIGSILLWSVVAWADRAEILESEVQICYSDCLKQPNGETRCKAELCKPDMPIGTSREEKKVESTIPATAILPALRITKDSLDAMLRDYPEARLLIQVVPSACEQQMEAAMRAMEPFAVPKTGLMTTHRTYSDAVKLWESANQACWSQP